MYVCMYVCIVVRSVHFGSRPFATSVSVCICMYACMYVCMHGDGCTRWSRPFATNVCVYVCMYVCMVIDVHSGQRPFATNVRCMCVYVYACMHICMYFIKIFCNKCNDVCMLYTHTSIHTHMHIYIQYLRHGIQSSKRQTRHKHTHTHIYTHNHIQYLRHGIQSSERQTRHKHTHTHNHIQYLRHGIQSSERQTRHKHYSRGPWWGRKCVIQLRIHYQKPAETCGRRMYVHVGCVCMCMWVYTNVSSSSAPTIRSPPRPVVCACMYIFDVCVWYCAEIWEHGCLTGHKMMICVCYRAVSLACCFHLAIYPIYTWIYVCICMYAYVCMYVESSHCSGEWCLDRSKKADICVLLCRNLGE